MAVKKHKFMDTGRSSMGPLGTASYFKILWIALAGTSAINKYDIVLSKVLRRSKNRNNLQTSKRFRVYIELMS
ncbi:hypothetical protein CEXT_46211 [Caerostris extrusa]|uniref:Uncharacterized protein n=1 Tax=Caerostris extrusa TaxID=172846 RepID=A0AAV4RKG9_CAEEX|nr:hypothetical protein CEXT_46211 [Caerostris extrusa]